MSWNIGTVGKGERIEVIYEFKGDPEAGFKVSDAQEIHGIDVGEEIDDDGDETTQIAEETVEETVEEVEELVSEAEDTDEEVESSETVNEEEGNEEPQETVEPESGEEVDDASDEESVDSEEAPSDSSDEDDEMDAALAKITGTGTPSESDNSEARTCPICNAEVAAGMTQCPVCSFTF
tara:strand:+ start:453 stop:989 length:537 start_codon:yes stop_codon:yes gene_type:complete